MRLLMTVLAVALTACGTTGIKPTVLPGIAKGGRVETTTVAGQSVTILHPKTRQTTKVVVYMHGNEELGDAIATSPDKERVVRGLLEAGYTVAASDAHGNNWGNPASVTDQRVLMRTLRARGLTDIYVLAQSAGGLDALATLNEKGVRAWAGIYPVCDLRSVYRLGVYREVIDAAYDSAPRRVVAIPDRLRIRFILWASPQDTQVPKTQNADVCARRFRTAGAHVTEISTTGDHGDPSNFDAAQIVKFFDRAPRT